MLVKGWHILGIREINKGLRWEEYWSRWPFPSPGDPSNPGIAPEQSALTVNSLPLEIPDGLATKQQQTTKINNRQINIPFPGDSKVKNQPANTGDAGSIPGS